MTNEITQAPKNRVDQLRQLMDSRKDTILSMLPATIGKERFMSISLAVVSTPEVMDCTGRSIVDCVYGCAKLGLAPDKALGHIYIIPRNVNTAPKNSPPKWERQATLMMGFRGYIELGRRSGALGMVHTGIVYQGETYRYWIDEAGPHFSHEPNIEENGERTPIAAYCLYDMRALGRGVEVLAWSKVLKSKTAKDAGPVWGYNEIEMARKTTVRMASKYWPLSPELGAAVRWDEQAEREEAQTILDATNEMVEADTPKRRSLLTPDQQDGNDPPVNEGVPPPTNDVPPPAGPEIINPEPKPRAAKNGRPKPKPPEDEETAFAAHAYVHEVLTDLDKLKNFFVGIPPARAGLLIEKRNALGIAQNITYAEIPEDKLRELASAVKYALLQEGNHKNA